MPKEELSGLGCTRLSPRADCPGRGTLEWGSAVRAFGRIVAFAVSLLASGLPLSAQEDVTARSFREGDDRAQVGFVPGNWDVEPEGPHAIASGENGEIYLLDQVNGRILKFDPRDPSAAPQALVLPDGVSPTDLVVSNGDIHVWAGRVVTLQATGGEDSPTRGLSVTRASEAPDDFTKTAFAQMGSVEPQDDIESALETTRALNQGDRATQMVRSRGRGQVVASFAPLASAPGVQISIVPKGGTRPLGRLSLQVRNRLAAAELLDIDKQGRYFVFGEDVPETPGIAPTIFVARFATNGVFEGIHELPLSQTAGVARRFVTITPDGDVYFLRNKQGASDVLAVGFRRFRIGEPVGAAPPTTPATPRFSDLPKAKGAAAAVRPLTRQQVLQTGAAFANVRWRVTRSAYGSDPDRRCSGFQRIRRPGYISGKLNQEVTGIPYCWGCHGSLPQIASKIEQGVLAGNICTRDDPRRDVAGVDCSAFVSAAWGLSTHFTTVAIPSITRELPSAWDLLPGDALNKPGSHVMLFVRFTADRQAEVVESATGGCNGRVCRNIYPVGSLVARGYRPVRYRALLNEPALASKTQSAPPVRR